MKSDRRTVIKNYFSLASIQAVSNLLPLIAVPYIVNCVGYEKYGLITFAQAFVLYLQLFVDFGFEYSGTQQIAMAEEEERSGIFNAVMITKMALAVVAFLFLCLVLKIFPQLGAESNIYYWYFLGLVGSVLFPSWFFQGIEKMEYVAISNILAKTIFTGLIFIFVRQKEDYVLVPMFNALGFISSGVIALSIARLRFKVIFKTPKLHDVVAQLKKGYEVFLSIVGISFYRQANPIILGLIGSNEAVGMYSLSEKIVKGIQSIVSPLSQALFPNISKKFKDNTKKTNIVSLMKILKLYIPLLITLALATIFLGPFALRLVVDKLEPGVVKSLQIMAPVILFGGLNYFLGIVGLFNLNSKKDFMLYVLYSGILSILTCILLVFQINYLGAAVSMVLTEVVLLLFIIQKLVKLYRA